MAFHLFGHVLDEPPDRGLDESPDPTVHPGCFVGTLEAFPVCEDLDDAGAADLGAVRTKCWNARIDLAVDGLDKHRRAVVFGLGLDPLGRDNQDLTDL